MDFDAGKVISANVLHSLISLNPRPMLGQNLPAPWIDLNLPLAGHPCPLKAKVYSTNAAEQRTKRHLKNDAKSGRGHSLQIGYRPDEEPAYSAWSPHLVQTPLT
jgi:hypothetical protein